MGMRLKTGRIGKWPVRSKFSVSGVGARGQSQRGGNAGLLPKVWILLCMFMESRHRELTCSEQLCGQSTEDQRRGLEVALDP